MVFLPVNQLHMNLFLIPMFLFLLTKMMQLKQLKRVILLMRLIMVSHLKMLIGYRITGTVNCLIP